MGGHGFARTYRPAGSAVGHACYCGVEGGEGVGRTIERRGCQKDEKAEMESEGTEKAVGGNGKAERGVRDGRG